MYSSVFQMFKIGIGPSSVHTVGPMRAAKKFLLNAKSKGLFQSSEINKLRVELYGSLAQTSISNNTQNAILMGLMGEEPETADLQILYKKIDNLKFIQKISLLNEFEVSYFPNSFILTLKNKRLPYHTNGMKFHLMQGPNDVFTETYYSIGGGIIESEEEAIEKGVHSHDDIQINLDFESDANFMKLPFKYKKAKDLFGMCEKHKMKVSDLVYENEKTFYSELEIEMKLNQLKQIIIESIDQGLQKQGTLPGVLRLKRRASELYLKCKDTPSSNPFYYLNFINAWAVAVGEENAAGGKVFTAPTTGTSGVISAVYKYYLKFFSEKYPNKDNEFLLTAAAIGILFKNNSTISGSEAGCQAEIGVGCSMAAAGLTAALGGSLKQIEKAAEISMEHFIGLTCGSVGGLVQIPCIERNAIAAAKAINSASLALYDQETQKISMDNIIEVMKMTGRDMKRRYKDNEQNNMNREKEFEDYDSTKEPQEIHNLC